jgi:8-oxo-dGTP pyrophosphatase MutT (NUDIX family)
LLADLWELPGGEVARGAEPGEDLRRCLREQLGLEVSGVEAVGEVVHVFTHIHLRLHVFRCGEVGGRVRRSHHQGHRWVRPAAFAKLPHATVTKKVLELFDQ